MQVSHVPEEGGRSGIELSRAYYEQVVAPVLASRWPRLPHSAGRLGTGSDVLGLDDEMSRDHDWGLRLTLLVPGECRAQVHDHLADALPETFAGLPTRYAFSADEEEVHRVEVESVGSFARSRLGVDPRDGLTVADWLSLSGQAVLEVTAGPIFADPQGWLAALRESLDWYPPDLWHYLLACDWARIDQELPLMSRAGHRGDELGSRVIAARLTDIAVHLGFLLERRWVPYSKWRGTCFSRLPRASAAGALLSAALSAEDWWARQERFAVGLAALLEVQDSVGLPAPGPAVLPFWDRPYLQVSEHITRALLAQVRDPQVRELPLGLGSVEQRSDNVDLLVSPEHRRDAISAQTEPSASSRSSLA